MSEAIQAGAKTGRDVYNHAGVKAKCGDCAKAMHRAVMGAINDVNESYQDKIRSRNRAFASALRAIPKG